MINHDNDNFDVKKSDFSEISQFLFKWILQRSKNYALNEECPPNAVGQCIEFLVRFGRVQYYHFSAIRLKI